jgi:hypothetical protein
VICLFTPNNDNDNDVNKLSIWAAYFIFSFSEDFCEMLAVLLLPSSENMYFPENVYECNINNIYPKNWFMYLKRNFFLTTLIIY